jgi:hypothetical protein
MESVPRERKATPKPVRRNVSVPGPLAAEVRRIAHERHLIMSPALVFLAERGVRAELEAKENLRAAYERFMKEREPGRRIRAGEDLVRAIFGADSIPPTNVSPSE